MFDIDPQCRVLRILEKPDPRPLTTSERLALAEREMEEAIGRWSEAYNAWTAEQRQAQPISAAKDGAVRF